MITPSDYITDKAHGNYYSGIFGAIGGLITNILFIQPLKIPLLWSWEGFMRGVISLMMIGAGSVISIIFKDIYTEAKPSIKRYFSKIKRKLNAKEKKGRNKRAA